MHLDEILEQLSDGHCAGVPATWAQGRTLYGGMTGALLCHTARQATPNDRLLRHIEIGLLKPIAADTPLSLETKQLASGRTVTYQEARLYQDDTLRATCRAEFVLPLKSSVTIAPFTPPKMKAADSQDLLKIPPPGLTGAPAFAQHFDMRLATDGIPFLGHKIPHMGGWMRFDRTPKKFTEAHLVGLIDAWPPAAIVHYDGVFPLSTLNWNIHFTEHAAHLPADEALGYFSNVNFGESGIHSSTSDIWTQDGVLVARSNQLNLVYEPQD